MNAATLDLLKYGATTGSVSVEHYSDGGKCYASPVRSMMFTDCYEPDSDMFDMSKACVDCSYKMLFGFPYLQCRITIEKENDIVNELENITIPLDTKKQNAYQRKIITLINTCSRRVIEQEMKKNKIAMAAVAYSTLHDNQYN